MSYFSVKGRVAAIVFRLSPTRNGLIALFALAAISACASNKPSVEPSTAVRALPPDSAPPAPPVGAMSAAFTSAFSDADSRARAIVFRNECALNVQRLRAAGSFGAAATAPKVIFCERTSDGVPVGGVFDIDSAFTKVRRLTAIRLDGARPRYTDAIDTARLAAEAKLSRDVMKDVTPSQKKLSRTFTVVALTQKDGTIEAWVMPWPTKARTVIMGGDIAMTRDANGALKRIVDHSATWKTINVATTGAVKLPSAENEIASVADLTAARSLADVGRQVWVITGTVQSTLVPGLDEATGARVRWEHGKIAP